MAARVRFLSLGLAGFGRYDRPTRFVLDGRSCSFTSANELGKSTFHAGLLATLFGPPPVRAKLQSFQERFRSWSRPPWFWGEVEFSVSDERWRVRRDFESGDLKVWRLDSDGLTELRYEERVKTGRKPTEPDPFSRLLDDWLGISDRSLYEAMFIVSQETTLAAEWRIDPRIAERIYGPAVQRISGNLQQLFDRFREITRNTREFQVSLGGQGDRNGRNDGRLDEVVTRITELETDRAAARERVRLIAERRAQLADCETRCESLRSGLSQTTQSLDHWRAWRDLESRLRPAVESYERLQRLNERSREVTRPLTEMRARLAAEFAVFDRAPQDLAERLEYFPLLVQAVDDANERQSEQQSLYDWLSGELVHWQGQLASEFADYRGRPNLADQVEELRLVRDEIAAVQNRARELADAANDPEREKIELELERLDAWRKLGPDWEQRLTDARRQVEEFNTAHDDFLTTGEVARTESQWLAEQAERIGQLEVARQELAATRDREQAAIAADLATLRVRTDDGHAAKNAHAAALAELSRRYADFVDAPANLIELWDELHAVESKRAICRAEIDHARETLQHVDRRTYWRRGLTALGVTATLISLIWGRGWVGWLGVIAATGLSASLRLIYRINPADAEAGRRSLNDAEADQTRVGRERDSVAERLGPRFVVPPEREAEWRRLWPAYRREHDRLEAASHTLPTDGQLADLAEKSDEAESLLAEHEIETKELVAVADDAILRARAERERRGHEYARLREQLAGHLDRYFATSDDDWTSQLAAALPDAWRTTLEVATAARVSTSDANAEDIVAWCRSLDDATWGRFADDCRSVARLEAQLTSDPAADAAHAAAQREGDELLRSLNEQQLRLTDAIAPFTADSDAARLRERVQSCQSLEAEIARRELELVEMPTPETLAAAVERATGQLAEAQVALGPVLEQFDHDSARALDAFRERAELNRQGRELENPSAEFLSESGFASFEELAHEAGKAEGLVGTIRNESQELLARASELWEAVDAPPELATDRCETLQTRAAEQETTLAASQRERAELAATIRQMEADPAADESAIQTELDRHRGEQVELEKQRCQLAAEFQESNRLMLELKRVERTALEGRITAYFADFSRTSGRRVELDDELRIGLRNDDGTRYAPDQLSHGARDQLYLAVYFATTAGLDLPFILDDPFVNCDTERLAAIRACWDRLIPDHQLILLSHDPHMASWAPTLEMREAA